MRERRWKQGLEEAVTFALVAAGAYLNPLVGYLLALTLPLSLCPAAVRGRFVCAALLLLAPCVGLLLAGCDAVLALCAPLPGELCLLLLLNGRRRGWSLDLLALALSAATLLALLPPVWRLSQLVGGPLFDGLAAQTAETLGDSVWGGNVLWRLASTGLLPVSTEYRQSAGFQLGQYMLLNPELKHELLCALRLRVRDGAERLIPSLLMQSGMLIGFFSALRAERAAVQPMYRPSFQTMRLPKRYRGYAFFLCAATLALRLCGGDLARIAATLTYAAFATVYRLLGAATLVFLLGRRNPERATLHGALAALLYVVFPILLFLLGIADQFTGLRASSLTHQEEDAK